MSGVRLLDISSLDEAKRELASLGIDDMGVMIMAPKMIHLNIRFDGLTRLQAAAIKHEILSLGGDAAFSINPAKLQDIEMTPCILTGTIRQIDRLAARLSQNSYIGPSVPARLRKLISTLTSTPPPVSTRKGLLEFGGKTLVMGILNVTPDSFSEKGTFCDVDAAVARGVEMAAEGADIIDIGGESTRPGAAPVPPEEEIKRVIRVIERLAPKVKVPISIDTCKAKVAAMALDAGADMVNDIGGLRLDPDMAEVAAERSAPVIIMHMKGTPQNMQNNPEYSSLVTDIIDYLEGSIEIARQAGIPEEMVIVDPGIGFGKTLEHNLTIMKNLELFRLLGRPILLGTSRKSFIGKITGVENAEKRQIGTAATLAIGVMKGANIVRVHDVNEAIQAVRMADAIRNATTNNNIKSPFIPLFQRGKFNPSLKKRGQGRF